MMKLNGIGIALMHPDARSLYPAGQMREAERLARDSFAPRKWLDMPERAERPTRDENLSAIKALENAAKAKRPLSQAHAMLRYWRKEAEIAKTPRMISAAESAAARWQAKIIELEGMP